MPWALYLSHIMTRKTAEPNVSPPRKGDCHQGQEVFEFRQQPGDMKGEATQQPSGIPAAGGTTAMLQEVEQGRKWGHGPWKPLLSQVWNDPKSDETKVSHSEART